MAAFDPLPIGNPLSDPKTGRMTDSWVGWLEPLVALIYRAPAKMFPRVLLTGQGASIATTSFPAVKNKGMYRLTYFLIVTTPATTGAATSSIQVTLGWKTGGVSQTFVSTALTGNTTTTYESKSVMVYMDSTPGPTYATTYASNTAGQMKYTLSVVLEQVDV